MANDYRIPLGREPYNPDIDDRQERRTQATETPRKPPMGLGATKVLCHVNDALESLLRAFKETESEEVQRDLMNAMDSVKDAQHTARQVSNS